MQNCNAGNWPNYTSLNPYRHLTLHIPNFPPHPSTPLGFKIHVCQLLFTRLQGHSSVVVRLLTSHRIQFPAMSLPDFLIWESYRTMLLVGGFSLGSQVSPSLRYSAAPYSPQSPSLPLKTSHTGMQGQSKQEIPEKTHQPVALFCTIPTRENPEVSQPGTEPSYLGDSSNDVDRQRKKRWRGSDRAMEGSDREMDREGVTERWIERKTHQWHNGHADLGTDLAPPTLVREVERLVKHQLHPTEVTGSGTDRSGVATCRSKATKSFLSSPKVEWYRRGSSSHPADHSTPSDTPHVTHREGRRVSGERHRAGNGSERREAESIGTVRVPSPKQELYLITPFAQPLEEWWTERQVVLKPLNRNIQLIPAAFQPHKALVTGFPGGGIPSGIGSTEIYQTADLEWPLNCLDVSPASLQRAELSKKTKVFDSNEIGATVAERLACSPPTKAIRVQSPAESLQIFACENCAGQCHWSANFLGDL
ncbi:hypothetical protein PR048_025021 [Dryococelus australis]|uniref:Uncharacterized protein n=1 Tax=Dryococelus australis TaxID=614101 RepID=A0ABQ9GQ92_9NEOP|nr:hypothetical protein PR048_025021 [Dryococelus australis]